jgi:hypothetical protein
MSFLDRRAFLGRSLAGLAAPSLGGSLFAADAPTSKKNNSSSSKTVVTATTKAPSSSLDTLFLTWRTDPTTTMVVQWIGTAKETPSIEFAERAPEPVWNKRTTKRRPYPLSDLEVFRVELTGLKPATGYQFRVGSDKTVRRFRTMPAKATDTFQFVSGGDCGTNSHAIANNILAAKQNPMFALIGGDLGYDNGKLLDTSLDFMRNYSRHMIDGEGRMVPMVVCLGNHEVDGGYEQPREKAPFFFALHDGLYDDNSYATLDFGDYLSLVLLDSGHISTIDGEQTSWLAETLRERTERPHLVAVNHVPAYPSYRSMESSLLKAGTGQLNREHWVPLFEQHNVDFVLEHHDHTFKRTRPLKGGMVNANGITYLGDGSWGQLRAPKASEDRPYLAEVSGAYHMSVHRLEGNERFHVALEETGRVVDVYRTTKRPRRTPSRSAS